MADAPRPPRPQAPPDDASRRRRAAARRRLIRRRRAAALAILILIVAAVFVLVLRPGAGGGARETPVGMADLLGNGSPAVVVNPDGDGVKVGTFLGDETRRFYGLGPAPKQLDVHLEDAHRQRLDLGQVRRRPAERSGRARGWTGQPGLVRDGGKPLPARRRLRPQPAQDRRARPARSSGVRLRRHHQEQPQRLREPASRPAQDDKLHRPAPARGAATRCKLADPRIAPYRAVTFGTGKELWRLPVPQTARYSRDCDGSGFFLDGRQYIGVESGWFYALDPFQPPRRGATDGSDHEVVAQRRLLLGDAAAPRSARRQPRARGVAGAARRHIYISSGAGHVYGMRRSDLKVVLDYRTGSDLDGTTVPTRSGKLLVPVEKQYITGHGGVLMLDPIQPAGAGRGLVLPHRRPQGGRLAGRRDRLGAPSTTSTTAAADRARRWPPSSASTATCTWSRRTRWPSRRVQGPNLEPGLRTPVEVVPRSGTAARSPRPSSSATRSSPPATTSACTSTASLTRRRRKGDAGALPSPATATGGR